jgi:hypothetical protein
MGLDMYLTGEAFFRYDHPNRKREPALKAEHVELGYWRKHPNLHGYIVNTFAKGVDECQRIELSATDLRMIAEAVESERLPHTEGFFFGASAANPDYYMQKYGATEPEAIAEKAREKADDLATIQTAVEWLETKEEAVWRSVVYQASW